MNEVTKFSDIATIDYNLVAKTAVELFADQALLGKNATDITIKDLETSRAKSNNFMEAIAGLVEISHKVELLSAEKDKFKRADELRTLNMQRDMIEMQTKGVHKTLEMAIERLEQLEKNLREGFADEDEENKVTDQIAMMQQVMTMSVDTGQKLVASLSRLIQLERYSGGRSWGYSQRAMTTNIKLVEMLDGEKGKKPNEIRDITPDELREMQSSNYADDIDDGDF